MILSKFKKNRQFGITYNLTLIYHQFYSNLALMYHTPHEVMRVSAIFTQKKAKKVCDINLTYAGYGAICVENSLPV